MELVEGRPVIGQRFQAVATLTAQPDNGGAVGPVGGIAVTYNQVGHFWGERLMIEPGAAAEALKKRRDSDNRDVLMLAGHDYARVLGRMSNSTLDFEESPEGLLYRGDLNMDDPEGRSAYEKVKRGEYSAASIGFAVLDGREAVRVDNSPEAETDEPVAVFIAEQIDVFEVSLVAQGVFGGATSRLAALRSQLPAGWAIVPADERPSDLLEAEEAEAAEPVWRGR